MTQSTNTAVAAAPSQGANAARKQRNKLILHVAIILVATLAIWFVPAPEGVDRAVCTCSPSSSAPSSA